MTNKPDIIITSALERDLSRVRESRSLTVRQEAAKAFAAQVEDGRANYGGMLGRVWQEAARALEAVEQDGEMDVKSRVGALRDLSRLMPMLAKAEAVHVARIGGVAVEDMSERQLEREVMAIRKRRKRKSTKP